MALEKLLEPQEDDAARAGTMNLTLASGFVAALGIILNAIPGVMKVVVGTATAGVRAAIFIAIVAAFAVVAAADILSRGYASAHKPPPDALPLGQPVHAEREDIDSGGDDWQAVALRETVSSNGDGKVGLEFLVTKAKHHPAWVPQEKLHLS